MKIVQENTGRKETEFDPEKREPEKQICAAVSQILWN